MKKELAEKCGECQFIVYLSRNYSQGVCDRFEDTTLIFRVSLDRNKCLYETPGLKISQEEIEKRKAESLRKYNNLVKSVERACKEIASWPKWKQDSGKYWLTNLHS